MAGPYVKSAVDVCKLAADTTPTAFCAIGATGSVKLDSGQQVIKGAGGRLVYKDVQVGTLELDCCGVDAADLSLWFPATAGVQVASFPGFQVQVGGTKVTLTECQPGAATISMGGGENEIVKYKLTVKGIATVAAAGTASALYTAAAPFTRNGVEVTHGASSKLGTRSFSVSNGMDCNADTLLDGGATAGHMTEPTSIRLAMGDGPTVNFEVETELTSQYNADTNTDVDVLIELTNGTAGDNVTITCADYVPKSLSLAIEGGEGVTVYPYELMPNSGSVWGRVAIT